MKGKTQYIPALNFHFLTKFYDPLVRLLTPAPRVWDTLVVAAGIRGGHLVLDLGCGPANLTIRVKELYPAAKVTGCDVDDRILQVARSKVAKTGLDVSLVRAVAGHLPLSDSSIDRVLTSLMLHHLDAESKRTTLADCLRILKPSGGILVADFRKYNETLSEDLFRAGFDKVESFASFKSLFGTISLWRAVRPERI